MRSFHRILGYMAALSLVVAACGGDDGNGGGGPGENDEPVANFTPSCTGLTCTFTDASTDADSTQDINAWSWDFGDDQTSNVQTPPQHTYAAPGTYTVTLEVTDRAGASNSISKEVTVQAPAQNIAPTAAFTPNCLSENCSFSNGSTDPNLGDVLTYAWSFGDGATSTDKDPTHGYTITVADTFSVTLTTTDAGGLNNSLSHDVVVAPPAVCAGDACDLTLQANATVRVTLSSEKCNASGNTLRITEPVDTTLFDDGCNTAVGTFFDLVGVFNAGTKIEPQVISGSNTLKFPPTLRIKEGTAYPEWVLQFDDGQGCTPDPTCNGVEPDFDDLEITITATPSP